ncbi:YceI family protein [Ferruginibacter lapsinanis]|uniref:YceI family protein n=1 Tax=Ferruginibacter lapsinanis TaxID=563172 RepID=UPI001E45C683|nr:YceI family protein [Ferruginibacter lapsinanis]UEG49549.1 YceI family protein [Ferruginibacter lapsinanis]
MKNRITSLKTVLALLLFQIIAIASFAQVKYSLNSTSIVVSGTSTLHDWTMKSGNGTFDAVFTFGTNGRITGISNLHFVTQVSELKSEKSAMDKNAYKSLKKDKFATITFTAASLTAATADGVNYAIKGIGKLTIAGVTHDIEVLTTLKLNADKSITVTGYQKLKMKDYGVEPPSFMFGAVKTGNDITIKFDLSLKK